MVLIPEDNVKDLAEIPDNIKNRLDIHPVKWIDQVLDLALERKPDVLPVVATSSTQNPEATESEPVVTVLKH
jgi:ATP-dependent Lon protease